MELTPLPVGYTLVDQYVIQSVLGSGGFGITYRALDTTLDHVVAIKEYFPRSLVQRNADQRVVLAVSAKSEGNGVAQARPLEVNRATTAFRYLPPNQEQSVFDWGRRRFINEARTLARLRHGSILQIFRVFEANGTAYIAYEMLDGASLDQYISTLAGPVTQSQVDRLLEPLLDALAVLHRSGIIHRDISPHNILIRSDGTPVLLDFGSARGPQPADDEVQNYTVVSPGYSPPELYQSGGELGPPNDIYSMAATVYGLMAGQSVPEAPDRIRDDAYEPLSALLSRETYRLEFLRGIDWALSVDVKRRPQSIEEWQSSLFPWKNLSARRALNRLRGKKIFISYRRTDTAAQAAKVYEFLAGEFGADEVFFDVDSIPYGVDFRTYVRGSILESAVVLAVIGSRWNQRFRARSWRLWGRSPDDFVQIELELAIENGVPIVPVLVGGTPMPPPESLPRGLNELSYSNAAALRLSSNVESDLERIASAIRQFRD